MHIRQQISLQVPAAPAPQAPPAADDLRAALQVAVPVAAQPAPLLAEAVRPEPETPQAQPESFASGMKLRYAELFRLHEQGKGVETIAKKLGMNKGEVNLILQLARQEERSRV